VNIEKDFPLLHYNTFSIDARCDFFIEIFSVDDLKAIINDEKLRSLPKLILGGGSNLLLTKDFHGLVIKNSIKGISIVKEDNNYAWLKCSAGEVWHDIVLFAIQNNLAGIENLSLIPGQVGAAPMQNIGAYGVELESVFDSLEAINMETGETKIFVKDECQFGYRESVFKKDAKGKYCIVSVTLRLNKTPALNISYGAIKDTLKDMNVAQPAIKDVSDAVIKIRTSKLPNPKVLGNAGSFFKNPEISKEQFEKLKSVYPDMPNFPAANNHIKIPAAWLIEQCEWKGKRVGNTGSHAQQALVLVNYGNATGNEIKLLSENIQQSVKQKFGIELTPEVNII